MSYQLVNKAMVHAYNLMDSSNIKLKFMNITIYDVAEITLETLILKQNILKLETSTKT